MKYLMLLICLITSGIYAQEEEEVLEPGWSTEGKFQLLFNQSAFNAEWAGGGTSSISGNLMLDYNIHYLREDFTWDTRILANYGLTQLKEDEFLRKTSDRFEINSIAGDRIRSSDWYYSFFVNFRTQFSRGFKYGEDAAGNVTREETTRIFSPAYLQAGPGLMWKDNENLWVNLAPATVRFIFVSKDFTSALNYAPESYYGVEAGKAMRFELGASLTGYAQTTLMENVSLENTLSLYSNYLDEPGNIDIDYLMNLNLTINKYLSANLIFQAIYDDNIARGFQIREVFGAGLNYSF